MGFKEEWKAEMKKTEDRVKEKQAKVEDKTETEKLAKEGRFLIKGFAFWLLIPALCLIAILLLFFGVWVWDVLF